MNVRKLVCLKCGCGYWTLGQYFEYNLCCCYAGLI